MTATDNDTGPQPIETDMHDRAQMAITENLAARTCILLGAVSILAAVGTARDPELRPWYDASQTGVMLSGGMFITWAVVHAIRGSTRERRHQHTEVLAACRVRQQKIDDDRRERREQHEELMAYLKSIHSLQGKEARVIGDVLGQRREGRG